MTMMTVYLAMHCSTEKEMYEEGIDKRKYSMYCMYFDALLGYMTSIVVVVESMIFSIIE